MSRSALQSSLLPAKRRSRTDVAVPELAEVDAPSSVVIEHASWELYEHLLRELDRTRQHVRVTYDDGRMEIMTLGNVHEQGKKIVARLIETYALAHRLHLVGVGSITLKNKEMRKGLEPDECYYVQTPGPPLRARKFDLKKYPPPDLGIEIDDTHSSVPREPIYAALGVPEVWRYDGVKISVLIRGANGKYRTAAKSTAFPKLSIADFNRFLAMPDASQEEIVYAFWDWLQK